MITKSIKQKANDPNGLSRPETLRLFKEYVEFGNVFLSGHTLQRSRERKISLNQIWEVLHNPKEVVKKTYHENLQEVSYQIRGKNNYQLAIFFKEDHLLVVTCMIPNQKIVNERIAPNEQKAVSIYN